MKTNKHEIDIKIFIETDGMESETAIAYQIAKDIQNLKWVYGTKTTITNLTRAQAHEVEEYLKSRDPRRAW